MVHAQYFCHLKVFWGVPFQSKHFFILSDGLAYFDMKISRVLQKMILVWTKHNIDWIFAMLSIKIRVKLLGGLARHSPTKVYTWQCDQIWEFFKVLGDKFSYTSSPNVCLLFRQFWKHPFSCINFCSYFLENFGIFIFQHLVTLINGQPSMCLYVPIWIIKIN